MEKPTADSQVNPEVDPVSEVSDDKTIEALDEALEFQMAKRERSLLSEFGKGVYAENPVFRLVLGLCPALAVTTAAINGLAMGMATLFVLLGANITISLIRQWIPSNVRIPSYIVVIATFVTIIDFSMGAFLPPLREVLGIFVPLIVVNCLILGRAEAFASKNRLSASVFDALGMGVGFTVALTAISLLREVFGAGEVFGYAIMGEAFSPAFLMILPPGGFIATGVLLALFNYMSERIERSKK